MTHEEYRRKKTAKEYAVNDLNRMADNKELPAELKAMAKAMAKTFESYHIEEPARKKPDGTMLGDLVVKNLLEEETGYLWKEMSQAAIAEREMDWVEIAAERFGVDIGTEWKTVGFHRDSRNRSELEYAIFLLVPGGWYAIYGTGRADCDTEKLRPNAELKSCIQKM